MLDTDCAKPTTSATTQSRANGPIERQCFQERSRVQVKVDQGGTKTDRYQSQPAGEDSKADGLIFHLSCIATFHAFFFIFFRMLNSCYIYFGFFLFLLLRELFGKFTTCFADVFLWTWMNSFFAEID